MKRPAFQFYPADWRKDMALQSCSVAARGLWIDMLCIAHECEPYGHLTVNGKPMTPAQIGRHTGLTAKECGALIDELSDAGVLSRTEEGVIFSRRMVRDEDIRTRRADGGKAGSEHGSKGAAHGAKGGRPKLVRGVSEPPSEPPLKPPPSSSSSSSSSEDKGPSTVREAPLGAVDAEPPAEFEPTPYGAITKALRQAGIGRCAPSNIAFRALVDAGATADEFLAYADRCMDKDDPFAYLLTIVKRERQRAAEDAPTLKHGSMAPPDPMAWRKTAEGIFAMAERLGVKPRPDEMLNDLDRRVLSAFQRAGSAQASAA